MPRCWLQLAQIAVCAALADIAYTDEAMMEALFVRMPGVKVNDVTAVAVADAPRVSARELLQRCAQAPLQPAPEAQRWPQLGEVRPPMHFWPRSGPHRPSIPEG